MSNELVRVNTDLVPFGEDLDWLRSLIWVTKEGVQLQIHEMSSSHLKNAIAWIDRNEKALDDGVIHYAALAKTRDKNLRIIDGFFGKIMTMQGWAHHVKETVAWFKLCREGMRLEQDRRRNSKRLKWSDGF